MLFMAGTGLMLAAILAGAALWAAWRVHTSRGQQQASAAESSVHLATLAAAACLVLLIVGWPLLYAMLGSFVAEVPGAMCIYGVTQVMPRTTAVLQTARPVAIFALGAWLLLEHVRRRSGRPPQRSRGLAALAMVSGFVIFSCVVEFYYVLNMNSLNEVSCCSYCAAARSAKLQAPAYYLPWDLPGQVAQMVLNGLFFAGIPLLALWLLRQSHRRTASHKPVTLAENALLLAAAAGLGLASLKEFSEVLAPLLMRLPFHHCLYCLMINRNVPDSPLMIANLAIGIFAAGWAAMLGLCMPAESETPPVLPLHRQMCLLGATTLLASVLMVVIHLAVAPS
jgi:hypothetical protein